jgi:hypothetical protein
MNQDFKNNIFLNINTVKDFERLALKHFFFQYENCSIYRSYCDLINVSSSDVVFLEDIPFLPIQFFKTHEVKSFTDEPQKVFLSSRTKSETPSKHYIKSIENYIISFQACFQKFYGNISEYTILALLPSYLERDSSSLVYMIESFINTNRNVHSGFYLNNSKSLIDKLELLESKKIKTLLFGVSFALLDLIDLKKFSLKHTIIMETGGMKGRKKEITKEQLHDYLTNGFGVKKIHSEYGMTELMSQAYSKGDGFFYSPPWMRVHLRALEDPFEIIKDKRLGALNIIDLANIDSCSFIATQDIGKLFDDGSFKILGRFDNSDVRGCNLLIN